MLLDFGLIDTSGALSNSTDYLYQYTSVLSDDSDERTSIGCAMQLGETAAGSTGGDSWVINYAGTNSLQSNSTAVIDQTFLLGNYDDQVRDLFAWEPEFSTATTTATRRMLSPLGAKKMNRKAHEIRRDIHKRKNRHLDERHRRAQIGEGLHKKEREHHVDRQKVQKMQDDLNERREIVKDKKEIFRKQMAKINRHRAVAGRKL